jgi:hypothetical protein
MATNFNGPPESRGEQVANPSKKLSPEEIELGNRLFEITKNYDGSPSHKLALAARSLQYKDVREVPARVAAYVLKMLRTDKRVPPDSTELLGDDLEAIKAEWYQTVDPDSLPEPDGELARWLRENRSDK